LSESDIERNFGGIWPAHVENFTWFIIQCRRNFDGDLDRFLVLCVIGDRTFAARNVPETFTLQDLGSIRKDQLPTEPINLQSIADFSGIPRETVRRKLRDLVALGWVERDERGNFFATRKAAADLAPLTEIGISYLAKMKAVLAPKYSGHKPLSGRKRGPSGGASAQRCEDEREAGQHHIDADKKPEHPEVG
jgi:hypothetical protein